MAPATAFGFLVLGLSLLFAVPRRSALLHQALAIAGLLVGWLGLSRFVFGGEALFPFADMAMHTAILFLLTPPACWHLRTEAGIARAARQRRCRRRDGAAPVAGGRSSCRCWPGASRCTTSAAPLRLRERPSRCSRCQHASCSWPSCWINAARGERADRLRRDAERALRLSEERHQLNFETALDGIITIDRQGSITGWNTHAEKMFGWPRAEATGPRTRRAHHPRAAPRSQHRKGMRRYVRDRHGARAQQAHRDVGAASRRPRNPGGAGHHAHRIRRRPGVQRLHPRHHRPHPRRGGAARERAALPHHGERGAGAHLDERPGQALHLVQPALAGLRRPRHRAGARRRLVRQPASGRFRPRARHLSRRLRRAPAVRDGVPPAARRRRLALAAGARHAEHRARTASSRATSAPASTSPSIARPSRRCARAARASRRWRSPCRR